jgi:hypothetical protein
MRRVIATTCTIALLVLLAGCSPYVDDYWYQPYQAQSAIPATQPDQPPVVGATASIVGIRNEDKGEGIPLSVEVRLQIDDISGQDVTFDPRTMALNTAQLIQFPSPILYPAMPAHLGPSQSAIFTAYFPFPPRLSYSNMDLNSLQLHWATLIDGRVAGQAADFRRTVRVYYYDPYYAYPYPPVGFYGGVVFVHRR